MRSSHCLEGEMARNDKNVFAHENNKRFVCKSNHPEQKQTQIDACFYFGLVAII